MRRRKLPSRNGAANSLKKCVYSRTRGAGREQAIIAERGIAGDVILPGIDRQASDEPHDDRHRRRRGGTSAEETPVFGWRDEIAHPRVPGAAADRRRALVNGKRPDQRHDAGLRSEQRCNRRSQQQTASDAGGPDADAAADAPALDQQNRRNLQQLRQEWDRRSTPMAKLLAPS